MTRLTGRTAWVTGAAGGIGRCLAVELARRGAHLVLSDIDEADLAPVAREVSGHGVRVYVVPFDLCDESAVRAAAARALELAGTVDVLVNNAGVGYSGRLDATPPEVWRRLWQVNFWGPVELTRAVLPAMRARGGGHIVNVSSGQAFYRMPSWGAYAVVKAAEGVWSEILRAELRAEGIRVTTVYPYMVHTGFYRDIAAPSALGRLSMRLLPLYSIRPETAARRIAGAIARNRAVEPTHPLSTAGVLLRAWPPVGRAVDDLVARVLAPAPARPSAAPVGFEITETMTGWHQFEEGQGPSGRHPFEFRVTWGTDDLRAFLSPSSPAFMTARLRGVVVAEGLCDEPAPCEGSLEFRYVSDGSIVYRFTFEAGGTLYRYEGRKVEIRPWNLPFSHTTCFGTVVRASDGALVSQGVTRFRLRSAPRFAASFRLVHRARTEEAQASGDDASSTARRAAAGSAR